MPLFFSFTVSTCLSTESAEDGKSRKIADSPMSEKIDDQTWNIKTAIANKNSGNYFMMKSLMNHVVSTNQKLIMFF